MKRTVKMVDQQKYIIEEFNNFSEFIQTNDSRKENFSYSSGGRRKGDDYWCGASYDGAVEMLRFGWTDEDKLNAIKDEITKITKTQDVQKTTFKNDIVGFAPIVPLAVMGVPQNMINSARKPKRAKVISIFVDVGMSSSVTVNEKLRWGAKLTAKVMSLEKQGYRVRIEVVKTFARDDWSSQIHACKIPVKHENQPFDIKRMMFPIAHPAMSRRLMFDWYERLPEAIYIGGYGRSLQHHSRSHAEAVKKVIADTENSYYLSIKDDIDKMFKE